MALRAPACWTSDLQGWEGIQVCGVRPPSWCSSLAAVGKSQRLPLVPLRCAPDLCTCPRPRKVPRRPYPPTSGFRCLGGLTLGPPGPMAGPFTSSALTSCPPSTAGLGAPASQTPGSEAPARPVGLLQAWCPPWAPTLSPSQASGSGHGRAVGAPAGLLSARSLPTPAY